MLLLDVTSSLARGQVYHCIGIATWHRVAPYRASEHATCSKHMELLPLQCSLRHSSAIEQMADLYGRSRDKAVSIEIDHFKQISKTRIS